MANYIEPKTISTGRPLEGTDKLNNYKKYIRFTVGWFGIMMSFGGIFLALAAPLELSDFAYGFNTGFCFGIAFVGVVFVVIAVINSVLANR